MENLGDRSQWDDIFKVLKGEKKKNYQVRILYSATLSFKNKGDSKAFPDKQKQGIHYHCLGPTCDLQGFLQVGVHGCYKATHSPRKMLVSGKGKYMEKVYVN